MRLDARRFWLPSDNHSWRVLLPQAWCTNLARFPSDGHIAAGDRGGARIQTGPLPLTYTALEVKLSDDAGRPLTLWTHLRIRYCARFDGREIVRHALAAHSQYLVLWAREGDYAYYNSALLPKAHGLGLNVSRD